MFHLSVFLVRNNFLSSILSTDQKVNDSFSIESKRKEPPDRHVSNARFLVKISSTEQSKKTLLPLKEKEKINKQAECEIWDLSFCLMLCHCLFLRISFIH